MPKKLTIDFETRSAADLKKWGAAAYAEHPSTEVICLALKWEGEEPVIWYSPSFRTARQVSDAYVIKAVAEAEVIEAHNAQFEYFIWKYVMSRYGFAMFDAKKLRCSAAKAAMFGLPRALEQACEVSGIREQKDKEGSRLMMSLCKPRKPTKNEMLADPDWPNRLYWRGTPEDFIRLGKYCMQDTRAEEAFSKHLPELPESEQEVWQFDLTVNDRGVRVDAEAASAIRDMTTRHSALLIREFSQMTGLNSPRQRDATLKHLIALGAEMEGLTAKDVEEELKTSENDTVRRILEVRQSLSKSSTAKYEAFLNARCADDRLRGMLMYHGAGTGRWTGKIVQPQNFPRGEFADVDEAISMFESGDMDSLVLFYGDPMIAAATCIRGMIVPEVGKEFVCADYNAIEGRVLAWLAGEETALDVYRKNRDPYRVAASVIYHKAYEDIPKKSHERQIGKTAELACGFGGSVGAFNAMAKNLGVELPEDEVRDIVEKWRASRPATVRYWKELEKACRCAIEEPSKVWSYRNVKFAKRGRFLALKLPSGRCLWYANPRIEFKDMTWGEKKAVVAFDGVDSKTRKWGTQYLYGGLLAENITQATARDILVNGMLNAEKANYPIVLHVHDEAVAEVPEGFGSVGEFEKLLCQAPAWAEGLPLKAEGWRGRRYRK